ncbi:MAG: hypothetical protein K8I01_08185 [Candidatus Methylomirabilis sp.]|nr:hypothetical protein [Deltaproteobacteria bacterium]
MKRLSLALATAGIALLFAPSAALSEININIGINAPPPAIVVKAPPAVVVIPGTYIYFAPDIDDVFFYGGYWWRPHRGGWYRAVEFGDPWVVIEIGSVPRVLLKLPPDYRRVPPGHERIPYGQLKKHWRQWEKEKRWERASKVREERREREKDIREERREKEKDRREHHREMEKERREHRGH